MKNKRFGERVRRHRLERGLTLRGFADIIEVSPTYVSLFERGLSHVPSMMTIIKIARALDDDEDLLLLEAGKIPPDITRLILENPEQSLRLLRSHFLQ